MADICNLEPFLYDAQPLDPVGLAPRGYGAGDEEDSAVVRQPQASSSANQINDKKLEDYLNRLRETLCTDLTAIEARLDALEAT